MEIGEAMARVMVYVAASTTITKVIIDALKSSIDPPRWVAPVAAMTLGILVVVIIMLIQGMAFTSQLIGIAVLAGILSGLGAIGSTVLQAQEKGGPAEKLKAMERLERRP